MLLSAFQILAIRRYPVLDENGDACALIIVYAPLIDGIDFKGSSIYKQEHKDNATWLWVISGTKKISVSATDMRPFVIMFSDYDYMSLESKTTYRLDLKKKYEHEEIRYVSDRLIKDTSDISWIVGLNSGSICGDYFGFYTEVKLGNPHGFGFELGYGPGLNNAYVSNWTVGIKGFTKGWISSEQWFLSVHYGTTLPIYEKAVKHSTVINPDGTITNVGNNNYGRYGFDFMIGVEKTFGWLHIEVGAGVVAPVTNTKILPAWSVGIGVDLMKLFN